MNFATVFAGELKMSLRQILDLGLVHPFLVFQPKMGQVCPGRDTKYSELFSTFYSSSEALAL